MGFVMNDSGVERKNSWHAACAAMALLLFVTSCDASVSREKDAVSGMEKGSAPVGSTTGSEPQVQRVGSTAVASMGGQQAETESTGDGYETEVRARAPAGISHSFFGCVGKAGMSKLDVAACISEERDVQDRRLNAVYKKLMGELDAESKPLLLEAQRAWLRSNQNESLLEDRLFGGGMMGNLTVAEGELFKLFIRANLLESYLEDAPQKTDGAEVR